MTERFKLALFWLFLRKFDKKIRIMLVGVTPNANMIAYEALCVGDKR